MSNNADWTYAHTLRINEWLSIRDKNGRPVVMAVPGPESLGFPAVVALDDTRAAHFIFEDDLFEVKQIKARPLTSLIRVFEYETQTWRDDEVPMQDEGGVFWYGVNPRP